MKPLRFKLKDRVVGKEGVGGTIVAFGKHYFDYCVEFDEPNMDAHDIGDDVYKCGHCRWANDDELEPYIEAAPEPYFAGARVGDSVYEMALGKGHIEKIDPSNMFPITAVFYGEGVPYYFRLDGKALSYFNQTLFYSKPVFDLPPPPKRKIKKVIEGWVNMYPLSVGSLHATEASADKAAGESRLGKAVFIRHEYEDKAEKEGGKGEG